MLLLKQKLHFLSWVLIIIYVEAVAMLFLFVVMLLNPTCSNNKPLWNGITFWILLFLSHVWSKMYSVVYNHTNYNISYNKDKEDIIPETAISLYENNFILILLLTAVLLTTLIGAFTLSRKK